MAYEITYPWTARFRDGSELRQFNSDGSENLFRLVLDRQHDLELFSVGPVSVDLRDGSFNIKDIKLIGSSSLDGFEEWGVDENLAKRIIYFRRLTRSLTGPFAGKVTHIIYAVGWQATVNGRNVKHIVYIHPNGELVFG